jgi:hypothetical protein
MPTVPLKSGWASLAHSIYEMSKFVTKHGAKLIAVATVVSPVDVPAIVAAFAAIQTFAALFERIHVLVDPNASPTE